jgi:hypothetical protein
MATLKNTQITGYVRMPNGTTAQRPTSPQEGMLRFNTSTGFEEYYTGTAWRNIVYEDQTAQDGLTPETAAPSAQYLATNYPNYNNGSYYIKPTGYSGDPIYVFCDLKGTEDVGIGFMRVQYADDYYSRSASWRGTGNSSQQNPPFSQRFYFDLADEEVRALANAASDVRQRFETWGFGSVGWTYDRGHQSHVDINNRWWSDNSTRTTPAPASQQAHISQIAGISWNVNGGYTSFPSPAWARNLDPTDIHDDVWRNGTFFFRDTSGNGYLPIIQISHQDVDGTSEQRYFPLRFGDNGSGGRPSPVVPSNIWIYI